MVSASRELAFRAGLTWEQFYSYTPFQVTMIVKAWSKNRSEIVDTHMLAAYHNAALSLYVNDPRGFPETFKEWYDKGKPPKPQTEAEASSAILLWARKNGLKD